MKKTSSMSNSHMHTGQVKENAEGVQKQLYEVDTEKLLQSNDKVTISDLWKAQP